MEDKIGENIKSARKARGLTQRALGEKIGKGFSTIQKYENGIIQPPISVIKDIAVALEMDPYSLVDFDTATRMLEDSINSSIAIRARLDSAFDCLNSEGQEKAVERVEELTEIPKYQKETPPEK